MLLAEHNGRYVGVQRWQIVDVRLVNVLVSSTMEPEEYYLEDHM